VRGYLAALEEPFGLTSLSPTFVSHHDSRQTVEERSVRLCQSHLQAVGAEAATTVPQVRYLLLAAMDRAWMVYLEDMELAIEEAALRGWAFDDTFDGYWERGHELFAQLWERVEGAFLEGLMAAQTPGPAQAEADEDLGGNHSE
jgi:preprotein translocase subunit SecA